MMTHVKKREGQSEEEEIEDDESNYTGIKIEQFFNGRHMLFDIFIKLGKSKFIKILHSGDSFSKDRLNKYKTEKEISHLYFHKKDRLKFVRWNNYFGSKLINMENVPQELKVNYMKNLTDKYLEEVGSKGMKPLVLEQGKEVCKNIFQMCEKDESLWKILRDLTALDPQSFTHSYLICLYASMVIKQFEWQSQAILETTAMAGMLHDIGKSKLTPELMNKRPEDMSKEEMDEYQKHPIYGVEMLDSIRSINPAVKQIVLQHHEAGDGTGFPFGLKDHKILTLSKVIFLCDEFVEYILSKDITPIEGLKTLVSDPKRITRYNGIILENFMKVFVSPKSLAKHESEQDKNKMMG
jgi:HD-GYP domain-containing protein (c-di-GMP phosphodiesterase class II)